MANPTFAKRLELESYVEELALRQARRDFLSFIKYVKPDYEVNWHHEYFCRKLTNFINNDITRLMIFTPPRHGKALEINTPILTTKGWKTIKTLKSGDFVFHPSGNKTRVIAKSETFYSRPIYEVHTDDGYSLKVDVNHLWTVRLCRKSKVWTTRSTSHLANRSSPRRPLLPVFNAPKFSSKNLPIPPYTLGAWLGDGSSYYGAISNHESDSFILRQIEDDGFILRKQKHKIAWGILGLVKKLKDQNLLKNKHIPDIYFLSSPEQRLALLQGIMDTDGYCATGGQIEITTVKPILAKDIQKLVWSLGVKCFISEGLATIKGRIIGKKYRIGFYLKDAARLPRKAFFCQNGVRTNGRFLKFNESGYGDTQCIQVASPDGLFLAGEALVVTHNSEIVSRMLPAFLLGIFPDTKIIGASYSMNLARAMSRDCQKIMLSEEYQKVFPETKLAKNSEKKGISTQTAEYFEITGKRGAYKGVGVNTSTTGSGMNFGIIDDPCKDMLEADSKTYQERTWDWFTSTFFTRLEKNAKILITLTRWHHLDLAGKILELQKSDPQADQYEVVSFPAVRENMSDPNDPRQIGEPLWPNKYPMDRMLQIKASVGLRVWTSLYQQQPSAEEGNIIKREWLKFYDFAPQAFDEQIITADLTFKETDSGDFTCIQAWGRVGANMYLLDQIHSRMDFPAQLTAIRLMKRKFPLCFGIYIEEAANGAAVISYLKNEILGIIPLKPKTSKEARVHAVTPAFEAGNVWLPNPKFHAWSDSVVSELTSFPTAAHDDITDSVTYAVSQLSKAMSSVERIIALSKR